MNKAIGISIPYADYITTLINDGHCHDGIVALVDECLVDDGVFVMMACSV